MKTGIVSYGVYIPKYRIKTEEIARVWGVDGNMITKGLNIQMKSVPGPDEDVITISVEAARNLMKRCAVNPKDIGAIYAGSESHPYAVKPTASVVAEAIDATPNLTSADYEFACKAGTAAIQTCMGLVGAGYIKYGLAIGADISQGAPGDPLEYSASAGGAAFLIGAQEGDHKPIALINHTASYTTDTPDFWRREGARYPSHGERFTGGPAYFRHIINCASRLFSLAGTKPEDYKYAVFHQPNGKFPATVGKRLGFTPEQIKTGLLCPRIGNTYSGATLIGLAAILDVAQPGDRIFAVSYGSGAGADGFDLQVTDEITLCNRNPTDTVEAMISNYTLLDYALYAKYREKIVL